ncbi:MAG: magnesium transporter [Candidatus Omnitrophica bacterium]|nr:magnesium transporter [Candidatus Omnitrophota bacterium]MDD5081456.1 magnesium transporter [Candidatus Omnitrophota bacterium]
MPNDVSKEIQQLINEKKYAKIKELLPSHSRDIANLIRHLPKPSYKLFLFRLVPYDKAVDIFESLSIEDEEQILNSLTSSEIKDILNEMSPDDRTELFEEMPGDLVNRFIVMLSPQEREIAVKLLNYPEDSVGRLITPDFVQLYEDMTVSQALAHIRKVGAGKETIYYCYVLAKGKELIGLVSLKRIVLADLEAKVSEIMFSNIVSVNAYSDKEAAAKIFKEYDILALPVVDNNKRLVGIVTFDDFVDVLEEEATEDIERMAGVLPVEKPYTKASLLSIVWKRSFWLFVLIVFETITAFIMKQHNTSIQQFVSLTFFVPVLIAMGGNTGTQSAAIMIRSIALGLVRFRDFFKIILREAVIGLFLGIALGFAGSIIVSLMQNDIRLSLVVSISMGITIFIAATVGASLPLIFSKLKLDPALMSGPMIATLVDVVGILIYFEIGKFMLGL